MKESPVIIVGGGLSGLCCALQLQKSGVPYRILEATDDVGGRVKTESFNGFRLDHGFQVLLTEYPEAKRVLDYGLLDLRSFEPGALIRFNGKFHRFVDPWRRPRHLLETAFSPVASLMDKIRMARMRSAIGRTNVFGTVRKEEEMSTMSYLQKQGFSSRIINRFFRPFFGGVFLENELDTTSRKFEFVFKMFSKGLAAIPANGIGEIAGQIEQKLSPDTIAFQSRVARVTPGEVHMENGATHQARNIVIACEAPAAAKILGEKPPLDSHEVYCLYFAADASPIKEPILLLNGEGTGPINNLCVPSQLTENITPENKSLISVTVLPSALGKLQKDLESSVRDQLSDWFGSNAAAWDHLKTMHIRNALPQQSHLAHPKFDNVLRRHDGIIQCGDYVTNASIQGAMLSGRSAADAILEQQ